MVSPFSDQQTSDLVALISVILDGSIARSINPAPLAGPTASHGVGYRTLTTAKRCPPTIKPLGRILSQHNAIVERSKDPIKFRRINPDHGLRSELS